VSLHRPPLSKATAQGYRDLPMPVTVVNLDAFPAQIGRRGYWQKTDKAPHQRRLTCWPAFPGSKETAALFADNARNERLAESNRIMRSHGF